jgi:hypothetical protein
LYRYITAVAAQVRDVLLFWSEHVATANTADDGDDGDGGGGGGGGDFDDSDDAKLRFTLA